MNQWSAGLPPATQPPGRPGTHPPGRRPAGRPAAGALEAVQWAGAAGPTGGGPGHPVPGGRRTSCGRGPPGS
ncbi:hypothetical protein BKD26_06090 [Streptomyces sp. CB03238]|nr:hypothetical protein BKD26_06090 [Streptomyces sp. CB03238]